MADAGEGVEEAIPSTEQRIEDRRKKRLERRFETIERARKFQERRVKASRDRTAGVVDVKKKNLAALHRGYIGAMVVRSTGGRCGARDRIRHRRDADPAEDDVPAEGECVRQQLVFSEAMFHADVWVKCGACEAALRSSEVPIVVETGALRQYLHLRCWRELAGMDDADAVA